MLIAWLLAFVTPVPDDDLRLPRTLAEEAFRDEADVDAGEGFEPDPFQDKEHVSEFTIGPVAGYIRARDADRGTWFAGAQARWRFLRFLAVEGSITFHQDEFQDGDVEVTQYPVQVTALLFPFPRAHLEPYGLFGAGWYYTRVDIDVPGGKDIDETDRLFGFHVGAGATLEVGPAFTLFGDFRWIFMDEEGVDNSNVEDEDFDSWQVTIGGSIKV